MASDPGAVTPRGSARRRFRRGGNARAHLEVAHEPVDTRAGPSEQHAGRDKAKRDAKVKTAGGTDIRAFIRANARVLLAVALLITGVVIVLLGWYGAAHTNILTEQVPYLISGGLLGMALIIVAAVIGSSASLERENRDLRNDLTRLLSNVGTRSGGSLTSLPRAATDDGLVYTVPGGRSFHLGGCPIVEGKQASEMPLEEATKAGFTTCKLCGPD